MQIANMITGFLFGFIYKVFKKLTLPISIFLMALGLFLVMTANNLFVVGIGAVLNGVSFAMFVPYIFNDVNSRIPQSAKDTTTSFILVLANIGNFVSPYGHQVLGSFGILNNELYNIFMNGSIILVILGFVLLFLSLKKNNDNNVQLSK